MSGGLPSRRRCFQNAARLRQASAACRGAGVRPGTAYGATDEIGWKAAENPVGWHDFHATVLHLLGIDHKRLTFYHNGINRRLTDVSGEVVKGLLA